MKIPTIKKNRTQVEEAIEEAKKLVQKNKSYKYTLDIDRELMIEFMGICKLEKTSAAKELAKFIERFIASREGRHFTSNASKDTNPGTQVYSKPRNPGLFTA